MDLVVGQDVALVLIGQCSGDLGRQLGVMLDENLLRQLGNQLDVAGLVTCLKVGFIVTPFVKHMLP